MLVIFSAGVSAKIFWNQTIPEDLVAYGIRLCEELGQRGDPVKGVWTIPKMNEDSSKIILSTDSSHVLEGMVMTNVQGDVIVDGAWQRKVTKSSKSSKSTEDINIGELEALLHSLKFLVAYQYRGAEIRVDTSVFHWVNNLINHRSVRPSGYRWAA